MKIELLENLIAELAGQITGSRIAKIHQPSAELFVFRLWNGRENLKLLISVAPQEARIHLTEQAFPNPFTPPRFCQLLRARLSRITGIRQLNDDRIVELACQGPKGDCRLVIELTGKSSNLILLDSAGCIVDVLKRQSGGRIALGAVYTYPDKLALAVDGDHKSVSAGDTAVSEAVEKLYTEQCAVSATDLTARLNKLMAKEQKRLQRRLKNIRQEQDRQQGFERYRQQGDLLLANMHLLKKGMQSVSVVNYYLQPPGEEDIILDPLLNPQDNAEKYYKRYKKARRGLEHSTRRISETEQELRWLEQLAYQLQESSSPADISLIADELKQAGLLKEKTAKLPRVHRSATAEYKETTSPTGYKILWGTNSRQNDALSTRLLNKGDLWFHAHRCPGSHVVLKADSGFGAFADADIAFAASIAAAFSRAKQDSKVEVMYAAAKEVKKPPRAKPGMVTVKQYNTLMVKPFTIGSEVF